MSRASSREIRRHVALPVGVGFGIRDAESARAIAAHADAVVIGSRIIEEIEPGRRRGRFARGAWLGTSGTRSTRWNDKRAVDA